MSKSDFWKKMFLGASLLLFGTGIALAADDVRVTSNVVVDGVQQGRTVTVTVLDNMGPVIGANVIVKGTTNGNITDLDGNAQLQNVPNNAVLQISYIGYTTREEAVNNRAAITVTLSEDTQALDEVVVVGYGTQAKKDITGSVAVVSADALTEQPVATFAEALQGRAAGVFVSGGGAPGAATTIRIRGVGSVNQNASNPLIVVDGVSNVNIESVNPNDIESLQVLKDASATAIYGAQGANGVIIVTTKQGSKDSKVRVSYTGYVGVATMANDGFDVLNGWETMDFIAQGMVNLRDVRGTTAKTHAQFGSLDANDQLTMPYAIKPNGLSEAQIIQNYGSVAAWEASYKPNGGSSWARSAYAQMKLDGYSEEEARAGTDWYDLITQKGFVQDHQLSLMGGNDKGSYSLSLGLSTREGTIKASSFDRYSIRLNNSFSPTKYLSMGSNTNLSLTESTGERGGQSDDSAFARTYTVQSWVPVYTVGGDFAGSQANQGGRLGSAVERVEYQKGDWNRNFRGQSALWAELKPGIEGLSIRTQLSMTLSGQWERSFSEKTIAGNKEGQNYNSLTEDANYRWNWQWTNTATYAKTFNEDHSMTLMVGTEAMNRNEGRSLRGVRRNYVFQNDENTWILNNGSADSQTNTGSMSDRTTQFGLFFRGDYSYQGKYLATVTVRHDADSRFGEDNRWGTFPSFSAGWRISEESFMEGTREWLDDLKLRVGYGTTGNSQIGAYNWATQYATDNNGMYAIKGTDSAAAGGYRISNLGDPNAKWETVKSFNVGVDASFFNKLTVGIDVYERKTTDMLVTGSSVWSALAGSATKPTVNVGDMRNRGVELSLSYRDRIGELRYNLTGNVSHNKNEILRLGSSDLFNNTRLQKVTIMSVGNPTSQFYGFKANGVYTSEQDVLNNKTSDGKIILPYAVTEGYVDEGQSREENLNPSDWIGRLKIEDVNGDGLINESDRTIIGDPHPDLTGGLNIGLNWRNWDLSTYLNFSIGNDIFKHYMYYTHYGALQSNYSKDRRDNSWHPVTNPNGKYPMWATSDGEGTEAANESNSMYVEDGSYLRMQTLSIGYSLPRSILNKVGLERIRVYGQVSNVFTITGYSGLDPEIRSNNENNLGLDYGAYGMPRQFIFGVNVTF
ncbi:TonB-dependent receptor [Parabacteroides sp. OttesenSCG-928-G07]|nr:TonB-dependent receptor [Parabacteroides sp. OttesenSCG-928-G21]MDL2277896.1 TonB-dependent receptor [Parabacteroides sp. OttesenSCG-928-G07]